MYLIASQLAPDLATDEAEMQFVSIELVGFLNQNEKNKKWIEHFCKQTFSIKGQL